jgi:hypothetical protein
MMPSQTRAQQCQAFNHILDNVLKHGDGSTLKAALLASGFDTMHNLMGIMMNQIMNLGYTTTLAPMMATSSSGADERKDEEVPINIRPASYDICSPIRPEFNLLSMSILVLSSCFGVFHQRLELGHAG